MVEDFPAAHSADTWWFAVDADGHVAFFDSGEAGAVPSQALQTQDYAVLQELAAGKNIPRGRHGRPEPSALGLYHFEHGDVYENWIAGLYQKQTEPQVAITVTDLPANWQNQISKCNFASVCFSKITRLQPVEHTKCDSWEPTYVTSDGLLRALPGHDVGEDALETFYQSIDMLKGEFSPGSYHAIVIQTDDDERALQQTETLARETLWASPPSKGFVCLFRCDDTPKLARSLSASLKCSVLSFSSVRDQFLRYSAFTGGELVDQYDSTDSNDSTTAAQHAVNLCQAFDLPKAKAKVTNVFESADLTPAGKLKALIKALGMPAMNSYERMEEFSYLHKNLYAMGRFIDK